MGPGLDAAANNKSVPNLRKVSTMNFTQSTKLVAKLILLGLSASLIACSQNSSETDQSEVSDDQPEVFAASDLSCIS
jgi:hypothetical protein